jgi:hypothetical protein
MKRPNELVREAVAIVVARGFTPTVSNGGKHYKLSWLDHGRRRHVLVISQSPSNQKARVQSRAILRRLLNGGRIMSQRVSGYERKPDESYETIGWPVLALLFQLGKIRRAWDPCRGTGRLIATLRDQGIEAVGTSKDSSHVPSRRSTSRI